MLVVAGEALFDIFIDKTGEQMRPVIGGSPLNVALGLARLGEQPYFLGGLSTDFLGDKLFSFMQKEKINTKFVERFNKPTTLSLIQLNESGVPNYAFYGEGAADRAISEISLKNVDMLHIGSYSVMVEPFGNALIKTITTGAHKTFISYDPNIRLGVLSDKTIWRARIETLAPFVSLLKMSDEDIHLLYGDISHDALAQQFLKMGVALFIITKGEKGACAYSRSHKVEVQGVKVQVVDTVGAGDTFQATCLYYINTKDKQDFGDFKNLSALRIEKMLNLAVKAAAITCSRKGADLPHLEDMG